MEKVYVIVEESTYRFVGVEGSRAEVERLVEDLKDGAKEIDVDVKYLILEKEVAQEVPVQE